LENQIILNCEAISKTDANQKSEILIWSHSSAAWDATADKLVVEWLKSFFYFL
jgi:hypothetical protein